MKQIRTFEKIIKMKEHRVDHDSQYGLFGEELHGEDYYYLDNEEKLFYKDNYYLFNK